MQKPAKIPELPPAGFDELSTEEKIEYVQSLWDYISSDADTVPLTDWQKRILSQRLVAFESDPNAGVSWEELRERLRRKVSSGGE
jgi:putative addiction module component (TIGR02574 family)